MSVKTRKHTRGGQVRSRGLVEPKQEMEESVISVSTDHNPATEENSSLITVCTDETTFTSHSSTISKTANRKRPKRICTLKQPKYMFAENDSNSSSSEEDSKPDDNFQPHEILSSSLSSLPPPAVLKRGDAALISTSFQENNLIPLKKKQKGTPKKKSSSNTVRKPQQKKGARKYDPLKWHPDLQVVWDRIKEDSERWILRREEQPPGLKTKLLPFQLEALNWQLHQEESHTLGGIIADEMGMGKTLEIISLLITKKAKPTLIVVPSVALLQWKAQFDVHVGSDALDICLYYGQNRSFDKDVIQQHEIVITTYQILEHGFRGQHYGRIRQKQRIYIPSPLHQIHWERVVLDEAHYIKDRYTSTARSVYNLQKRYRWCLTGTPLQNKIGELYSLIKFIDVYPYSLYFCRWCPCEFSKWNFQNRSYCPHCNHHSTGHSSWMYHEVIRLIQKHGTEDKGLESFRRLHQVIQTLMLRRTKLERLDDLNLPPRVVEVRRDYFSEPEQELYKSLFSDCVRKYQHYIGNDAVLHNYTSIFSLLSRMRLSVNHPDLVINKMADARKTDSSSYSIICSICHEEAEDPIVSKCKHIFCRLDVEEYIKMAPVGVPLVCPRCFRPFVIDLTQEEMSRDAIDIPSKTTAKSCIDFINLKTWRSSTKIEALVEELTSLQKSDSTLKSIVFSQFVSFLDLIQWRLSRSGFNVIRLDGKMGPFERNVVITKFMTDPTVTVFLMSLKAGGVALNLTEASCVFIMDPWWNPAVENQAFDRIHRIGQRRPVIIKRIIIEDSIESKILQLQEKKQAMFSSTVGKDQEALERLSREDLQFLFSH